MVHSREQTRAGGVGLVDVRAMAQYSGGEGSTWCVFCSPISLLDRYQLFQKETSAGQTSVLRGVPSWYSTCGGVPKLTRKLCGYFARAGLCGFRLWKNYFSAQLISPLGRYSLSTFTL